MNVQDPTYQGYIVDCGAALHLSINKPMCRYARGLRMGPSHASSLSCTCVGSPRPSQHLHSLSPHPPSRQYTFNLERSVHFPVWTEPVKMGLGGKIRKWTCNIALSPKDTHFSTSTLIMQYPSQHMQSEEDLIPTATQSQPPRLRCAAPSVFTPSEIALHRPTSRTVCHSPLDKRSRRKNGTSQRDSVPTLNKKNHAGCISGDV
ncbi:hypothetical protein COCVIDRAFT_16901 [Bipolaris victoriae FI3]|uniref:Uncharacterized protein n=1 Tax=Bipolaris victoriae (strain FI3) TaxID=930091 RepID=W7ENH5_BIPV3|nr:hypothetical protein COCVIDRAFT_16901 [Bipolaris victoriae FI3]